MKRLCGFQFNELGGQSIDGIQTAFADGLEQVQLLRVGKFNHPDYGPFEISSASSKYAYA